MSPNWNIASKKRHLAEDLFPPPGGLFLKRCSDYGPKNNPRSPTTTSVITDVKYDFLTNYCPLQDEFATTNLTSVNIISSGQSKTAKFSIEPFRFLQFPDHEFDVRCRITICFHPKFECKTPGVVLIIYKI